jgi:MFS family permease
VPAGAIGDKLNRRVTVAIGGVAGAVCAGVLAGLALSGSAPLPAVLALGLGMAAVRPLSDAAFFATLAGHGDDGFISVGTFMSSANVFGRIAGPIAAGVLIVLAGPPLALALIAALFGAAAAAAVIAPDVARRVAAPASMSAGLREAAAYLAGPARQIVAGNTIWNLFTGGASLALIAPFVASIGGNAAAGSAVMVAGNLSALACAAAMPLFISRFGTRAIMIAAFPLTGLGLLIFSLSNSIPAAIGLYALEYFVAQSWVSGTLVATQSDAPRSCRASVASLSRVLAFGGIVIGGAAAGLAAGAFGVRATIAASGLLVLGCGLALAALKLSRPSALPSERVFSAARARALIAEGPL